MSPKEMLAWLFPLGPCLQFYLPGVPLILVLSLPQHSPDTWQSQTKSFPGQWEGECWSLKFLVALLGLGCGWGGVQQSRSPAQLPIL